MAQSNEKVIKARREAQAIAAKRRDDEFFDAKQRSHDEAVAKMARLRELRLANAASVATPPTRQRRTVGTKVQPGGLTRPRGSAS